MVEAVFFGGGPLCPPPPLLANKAKSADTDFFPTIRLLSLMETIAAGKLEIGESFFFGQTETVS